MEGGIITFNEKGLVGKYGALSGIGLVLGLAIPELFFRGAAIDWPRWAMSLVSYGFGTVIGMSWHLRRPKKGQSGGLTDAESVASISVTDKTRNIAFFIGSVLIGFVLRLGVRSGPGGFDLPAVPVAIALGVIGIVIGLIAPRFWPKTNRTR